MTDQITREVFDHLVELAALELTEEEAEYLRGELNKQLTVIEELAAIPIDEGVEPAAHGVPYTPGISAGMREDKHNPFPDPAKILKGAPESEDGYFIVPDIPLEDLD